MHRFRKHALITAALLIAGGHGPASQATEVFTWTDENGVVHFSQTAPVGGEREIDRVALRDDRPANRDPDTDIYNVEAQQQRMQELREDRARRRQERLENQRRQAQWQAEAEARRREMEERNRPYPVYYVPPWRPVRPRPPVERPEPGFGDPLRPSRPITPPRPIVPGPDGAGGGF